MIIHVDIDSFFVSATRVVDPSLEGKPVAIGGRSDTKIFENDATAQVVDFQNSGSFVPTFYKAYEERDDDLCNFIDANGRVRGILTTASYEARAYGVKTAMRIVEALQLCPDLIIKAPNMSLYQELSHSLYNFLALNIPLVEQASIDEFYGDLGGWIDDRDVLEFADILRHRIKRELKLPVSIGVGETKYIAKLATGFAKPFGSKVVYKDEIKEFVHDIFVEEFPGVGRSMRKKLHESGIYTLGELLERKERVYALGPYAKDLYRRVNGEKDEPLKPNRQRKSIGISRTIDPLFDRVELLRRVHVLARHLSYAILKLEVMPTRYHLSLRYEMGKNSYANVTSRRLFSESFFDQLCVALLHQADIYKRLHVIRISIYCGSFTRESKRELDLTTYEEDKQRRKLSESAFKTRQKYGLGILKWGSEMV
ncbi:DNA polymerase IV [hydrothermal vent metagenome]|uniref:DNA polymerase IV n=1 Tax=hydrothermal vent metagenome TaxID=652676 RepID=A0A1W1BG98_9ZZZZ